MRTGLVSSGVVNLLLALFTLSLLVSGLDRFAAGGGGSGSDSTDSLMRLLGLEHSHWLIWAIALIPLGVGIAHLIKAWRAHFERYFQCDEGTMRLVRPVSRIGLAARGCSFLIIAGLLFMGGSRTNRPTHPASRKRWKRCRACPPVARCCWQSASACWPSPCTASPKRAGGGSICPR